MEVKITRIDDSVEVQCTNGAPESEPMVYSEIVSLLFAALDGATTTLLKSCDDKQKGLLYDQLDGVFDAFLSKVFPEFDTDEFTLIDAAIVKAQDEIINDAFERGISLEEALEEYQNKALDYVNERRKLN